MVTLCKPVQVRGLPKYGLCVRCADGIGGEVDISLCDVLPSRLFLVVRDGDGSRLMGSWVWDPKDLEVEDSRRGRRAL